MVVESGGRMGGETETADGVPGRSQARLGVRVLNMGVRGGYGGGMARWG